MDLKKLMMMKKKNGVLEKFIFALSSKRNLIIGFCFGIGVSLFIFTIVFFNHSSTSSINPSFLNPMFQGFNGIYMNSSSLSAWYFPFSSSSSSSSIDLLQRNGEQRIQQKPSGNELVLKNTHEGKLIDEDKNSSFCVHKGGLSVTEEINGSKGEEEDTSFLVSSEGKCQGKLTKKVKNVTFPNAKEETFHERRQEETRTHVHRNEGFRERMTNKYNRKHKINSERTHDHQKFEVSFNDHGDEKRVGNYFGDCDIFDGKWVKLDKKSYYPYGSCPYIDRDFDCQLNGRPDDEFLKWQWQPNDCNIPRLNATDFLERLRGKRLLFVGDSLNRNMWESLVCILRNGVRNKKRVYEISGKTEFKKKGVYSFRYEDYNCSIDFANSPYLVRQSYYHGKNRSMETLRLDLIDQTLSANSDSDVIVYNSGHWWTHDKTSQGEYYYQEGNFVYPKLNPLEAYEKALTTWGRWVDKNIDINRTQVVFRGYSPTHFRGGQWNSGGQCHRETKPILNETYLEKYPSKMKVLENILLRMKTPVLYLNISKLTDYRKDAHPSIYRKEYKTIEEKMAAESSQDCSHWCLPGVPDTWNELLYASLLNSAIKSLKN